MIAPHPLLLIGAAAAVAALGLMLWQREGIMVALSGLVAYCL